MMLRPSVKLAILCFATLAFAQKPAPEAYVSPRIEKLKQELATGSRALDRFWDEMSRDGTPLVESLENDPNHVLVTFLWRGGPDTRNVLIQWPTFHVEPPKSHLMTRLSQTNVWYRTLKVRRDARILYRLSPNAAVKFRNGDVESGPGRSDPLNPKRGGSGFSEVELPGAPPQPYVQRRPGVPEGQVERRRFASQILGNERDVEIYTPADHTKSGAPYPLLVVFDLANYRKGGVIPTPTILDNLIAERNIPPLVAVLVGNVERFKELACNPNFAEFLHQELVPWARREFHATAEAAQTVLAGSSFGGLTAACAAIRHPETFGNVLSQSGSFNWEPDRRQHAPEDRHRKSDKFAGQGWVARQVARRDVLPVRFYLSAGVFETWRDKNGNTTVSVNHQLRDVLTSKGCEVLLQEFAGGHDYLSWRGLFSEGLVFLLHNRVQPGPR